MDKVYRIAGGRLLPAPRPAHRARQGRCRMKAILTFAPLFGRVKRPCC